MEIFQICADFWYHNSGRRTERWKSSACSIKELRNAIEDAEGDVSTCYLFINPALVGMVEDLDTTASRRALEGWAGIVKVPSADFIQKLT